MSESNLETGKTGIENFSNLNFAFLSDCCIKSSYSRLNKMDLVIAAKKAEIKKLKADGAAPDVIKQEVCYHVAVYTFM